MLKNYSKIKINEYSTKRYFNDKEELHRLDGPAVEYLNGSKFWHINEKSHRNIDPSEEYSDGEKRWFIINKRHRIGGLFCSDGKLWRILGKEYTKQEYFNVVWDI